MNLNLLFGLLIAGLILVWMVYLFARDYLKGKSKVACFAKVIYAEKGWSLLSTTGGDIYYLHEAQRIGDVIQVINIKESQKQFKENFYLRINSQKFFLLATRIYDIPECVETKSKHNSEELTICGQIEGSKWLAKSKLSNCPIIFFSTKEWQKCDTARGKRLIIKGGIPVTIRI